MLASLFNQEMENETAVIVERSGITRKIQKPPAPRDQSGFVGLENQGATCYLNALIQAMYMTPELRKGIFNPDPVEFGLLLVEEFERSKEENAKQGVIEADETLLKSLTDIGISESVATKVLIATKNASIDACIEFMELHPDLDKDLNVSASSSVDTAAKKKRRPRYIPLELQRLFSQLKLVDQQAVSTSELTTKGFSWKNMDGHVQHDAHELNRLLIDALAQSLKKTSGEGLCQQLYEGCLANQIRCLTCGTVSEREEVFYDLNVQVTDCSDLVQSLREHCVAELLTGDSAYQCNTCNVKRNALRASVLRKVPPVLTFSCCRFRIDRTTNWQRVKVVSRSEFPLLLDMELFAEGGSGMNDEKLQPHELETDYLNRTRSGMLWLQQAVDNSKELANQLIDSYGIDVSLHTLNHEDQQRILCETILYQYLTNPKQQQLYQLQSVIMHRGSAHSGHYFAYIRDSLHEGHWTQPLPVVEATKTTAAKMTASKKKQQSRQEDPSAPLSTDKNEHARSLFSTGIKKNDATAVAAKHDPRCHYVISKSSKLIYISETSPLALIVQVLKTNQEFIQSKLKGQQKRGAKHPSVTMQFGNLGRELTKLFPPSVTWANTYVTKLGSMESYLARHSEIFDVNVQAKLSSVGLKASAMRLIQVVSSEKYDEVIRLEYSTTTEVERDLSAGAADDSHADVYNEDEALARALQSSLNFDASADITNGKTQSEDTVWETVGNKKRSAVSGKNQDSTSGESAASSHSPAVLSPEEELKLARDAAIERVSNEILNRAYGTFYEFNDSVVSPMTLSGLERSFAGQDSAYLLVYRRCDAHSLKESLVVDKLHVLAIMDEDMSPPAHWAQEIAVVNSRLAVERATYEASCTSVKLLIRCPKHVTYECPFVKPTTTSTSNNETDDSEASNVIVMEVSNTCTVSDTLAQFISEHSEHLVALGLSSVSLSSLALSRLEDYGPSNGYYVSSTPMDHSAVISEVLENNSTLCHPVLLWDGSRIDGHKVLSGFENVPKKLFVRQLDVDKSDYYKKNKIPRVLVFNALESFWVPYSLTISELCYQLADRLSIDPFKACIHSIEDSGRSKGNKSDNALTTTLIFENGSVVEKIPNAVVSSASKKKKSGNVTTSTNYSAAPVIGRVLRENSLVGEVWEWLSELVVENRESRGLHSTSLAELFATQKSTEITVTVELDFQCEQNDTIDGNVATIGHTVEVDIPKNSTVLDLRVLALHRLGLDVAQYREDSRLRLGMSRGEGILEDSVVIFNPVSGIKNSCTLYLERGPKPLPDSLSLTVVMVTGNSHAFKYSPAEGGERGLEVSVDVLLSDTVTSLRDKVGCMLWNYSEDWTKSTNRNDITDGADGNIDPQQQTSALIQDLRLRRTSWLKEATDLLLESSDKGTPLTLGECGLQNGDTLLLEEGKLPIRGQITIQIYIWNENSTPLSDVDVEVLSPLDAASKRREQCLVHLISLDVMEDMLLVDFQIQVFEAMLAKLQYLQSKIDTFDAPKSVDHFLLRELRNDMLPGRCFWTCPAPAVAQDLTSIGRSSGGGGNPGSFGNTGSRSNNGGKKDTSVLGSLKRLQLKEPRNVVVEILSDVQHVVRPAAGAFRVWVQQLINPGADEGSAIMSPTWPPRQVLVNGGVAPSLMHLKRPICSEFPDIALDRAVVYKFNPVAIKWVELSSDGKKKGKNGTKENILQQPYGVKEGDQFCVFQSKASVSTFGSSIVEYNSHKIDIALPEDVCRRSAKEIARVERNYGKKNKSSSGAAKKSHVEIGLSLGSNFHFSDEEDESVALNTKLSKFGTKADDSLKTFLGGYLHGILSDNRLLIFRLLSVFLYYVIGVLYYRSVEGWNVIDSVFFITVSVATIGYGDFHPTTDHSRLFTAFFIIFGLAFVLTAVDDFARYVAVKFQNITMDKYFSLNTRTEKCTKKLAMSSASLVLLLVFGTLFFMCNEKWSSATSFYFTVVTMATVGYGDVTPKHASSRGFTIVFVVMCLVTYATMIQNFRETYILSLSLPLSDSRDSSGSAPYIVGSGGGGDHNNVSLNRAAKYTVRDADNNGDQIEMGNVVGNDSRHKTSAQSVGGTVTFNPLDTNNTNGNVPRYIETEKVDVVQCLLLLLEQRSRATNSENSDNELTSLKDEITALREKYSKTKASQTTSPVEMTKKEIIHFIATHHKVDKSAAVGSKEKSPHSVVTNDEAV